VHTADGSVVVLSNIHTHAADASEPAARPRSVACEMVASVSTGH